MKAQRRPIPFSIAATAATVALVGFVGYAAMVGHDSANQPREVSPSAHHMASLGEISALLKKGQSER
jgi:hypothetical protein